MDKLDELARQERLEYYRKWRERNKDKVRKNTANYWRRKAERKFTARNKGAAENGQATWN